MYIFVDHDDNDPSKEYDISGQDYERLIDNCFRCCHYFSLNANRSGTAFDLPEKELAISAAQQRDRYGNKHFFYCSDKARQYLLSKANSLFSWITWGDQNQTAGLLPEDLCFYRSDGSVFLWSETHEGVCGLYPRSEEDVSEIVASSRWLERNDNKQFFGLPSGLEDYNIFLS